VDCFWAVENASFEIEEGKIHGIIGENGAGKSTLLALIAGILKPDRGDILLKKGLRTTLLSLQAGFNPHLSGRDNITISALLLGMTQQQISDRMEEMIELADISPFIDQPLRTYSTGMKARLGFATAYHTHAEIMLLDEVFAVGDLEFSRKAQRLMEKKIQNDKTVVMVSHGEHLLKELCQSLIWIRNGKIEAQGSTDEIWAEYRKASVHAL